MPARVNSDRASLAPTPSAPPSEHAAVGFGVYVHIPFCTKRCDYCAFATWTDKAHLAERYVDACRREIGRAALPAATSVFVGGGTPSLLPGAQLASILMDINLVAGAEVTVECNPDTVTEDLLREYRGAGVNRISLGVQSMVPHVLKALGRTHDPDNVQRAVAMVRRGGFASFNVDLIYGATGESLVDWRHSLESALALDAPHVSAYGLTVEPGTPLADDVARHPDDDDQADKYLIAEELLTAGGLANYEISNWSLPGHECRHNLLYWTQGNYSGIGCAAHSHHNGRRWWNHRTPERYIASIDAGETPVSAEETLNVDERNFESAELALRMRSGVPVDVLDLTDPSLEPLLEPAGSGYVRLNVAGRLLANEVAVRLRT